MAILQELATKVNDKFKGTIGPDILSKLVTFIDKFEVTESVSPKLPPLQAKKATKHEKNTVEALNASKHALSSGALKNKQKEK